MALFNSLYLSNILLCIYTMSSSSVSGHSGCFHFLAIINSAAMNIGCMYLFKLEFSSFLDICWRVVLLGYYQMNVSHIVKGIIKLSSVQLSHSAGSDSLWPHGLQHARLPPCPSPTPGVYSDSCPLSRWCHSTISSSVALLSPSPSALNPSQCQDLFQWVSSWLTQGGQSNAASASVLPMNIQDWFPLGWTGWFSLQSKGLSRVFSNTTVKKKKSISFSMLSFLYSPTLTSIHDYWENHSFD